MRIIPLTTVSPRGFLNDGTDIPHYGGGGTIWGRDDDGTWHVTAYSPRYWKIVESYEFTPGLRVVKTDMDSWYALTGKYLEAEKYFTLMGSPPRREKNWPSETPEETTRFDEEFQLCI